MNHWFENNMVLRFIALILGTLIWLSVGDHTFPTLLEKRDYSIDAREVQIQTRLDRERQVLLHQERAKVDLVLTGNQKTMENIAPVYRAYIDLRQLKTGTYQYATIQVEGLPAGVSFRANPQRIRVFVDQKVTQERLVQIEWAGKAKKQLETVLPTVTPKTAQIQGPETQVSKVTAIRARYQLDKWHSPLKQELSLHLEGNKYALQFVSLVQDKVTVEIPAGWEEKEVTIRPMIEKPLPSGYELARLAVIPSSLRLFGRSGELAGLTELPVPLDLSKVMSNETLTATIALPDTVTPLDAIKVRVQIELRKPVQQPPATTRP